MIRIDLFIAVFLLSIILNSQVSADNIREQSREQQIAEKLALIADADEIVYLKASGDRFIGVYKNARDIGIKINEAGTGETSKAGGVVILVHGMGAHPDWPDVISPLRTRLTESAWSTFSIQMPILPPEESVAEYGKTLAMANSRIQAAVDYLHDWGIGPIILLGYGFGAVQAASYLASEKPENNKNIKAFVSVSILAQKFIKPGLDVLKLIGEINIPILDIYGEDDLEDVRRGSADRRLAASKSSNNAFKQIELQHAGHHYLGAEKALVEQIHEWLQQMISITGESREISEISPEILQERQ